MGTGCRVHLLQGPTEPTHQHPKCREQGLQPGAPGPGDCEPQQQLLRENLRNLWCKVPHLKLLLLGTGQNAALQGSVFHRPSDNLNDPASKGKGTRSIQPQVTQTQGNVSPNSKNL